MSFFELLRGIGDRIGILEMASSRGSAPVTRIRTRVVTLSELAVDIRSGEVRAMAEAPAELAAPLERIFETAGVVTNANRWTVDKLKQLVQSEPFKNKPKEEIQKMVLEIMNSEGAKAEDVVKDAIARDRALDSFEAIAQQKMQEQTAACKKRILEIDARIERLHQESAGLKEKAKADERKWSEWKQQKRAYERELATVIGYIVDHPVITTDDDL